jgi:P27 family predicted phage terminase small subunit
MGRRGPKPEPAAVKLQKGSSRRPVGADPQDAPNTAAKVAAPSWLKGGGLEIWTRLAPRLSGMNLLTPIDAETFGRYCRNFARWFKMQLVLDEEGETYESESAHGKLKRAHPAFLISDRLERQLNQAEANFGLNPAERQRIFAARAAAAAGAFPDLFGHVPDPSAAKGKGKPKPAEKAEDAGRKSAVGFLQ